MADIKSFLKLNDIRGTFNSFKDIASKSQIIDDKLKDRNFNKNVRRELFFKLEDLAKEKQPDLV